MKPSELWRRTLPYLTAQMGRSVADRWLGGSYVLGWSKGKLYIHVRDKYAQDWLNHKWWAMAALLASQAAYHPTAVVFTTTAFRKGD